MKDIVAKALAGLCEQRSAIHAELSTVPAAAESEARSLNSDEQAKADALIKKMNDAYAAGKTK